MLPNNQYAPPALGSYVVPTRPQTYTSKLWTPPGLVPAAAYADLDAMGQPGIIEVPTSGVILSATYFDLDDEGLAVDLWLFTDAPGLQTDNSAFVLAPGEITKVITVIQFTAFKDANTAQISEVNNIGRAYKDLNGRMWAALQARSAVNIATLARPYFQLSILPD